MSLFGFDIGIMLFLMLLLRSVSARVITDPTCPTDNYQLYVDPKGYTYEIRCSADIDLQDVLYYTNTTTSLAECSDLCTQWNLGAPAIPCVATMPNSAGCYLYDGYGDSFKPGTGNYTIVQYAPSSSLPPPPVSFNATCGSEINETAGAGDGSFEHYLDPYGYPYFTLCGKANARSRYTFYNLDPPVTLAKCSAACSFLNIQPTDPPIGPCYGAVIDPVQQTCQVDLNPLGEVIDSGLNSAYNVGVRHTCSFNSSQSDNYTDPEGDNYTVAHISTSDVTTLLSSSDQSTSCGCAEQCSLFNRAYPNATQCLGVKFDPSDETSPNCLVKSN